MQFVFLCCFAACLVAGSSSRSVISFRGETIPSPLPQTKPDRAAETCSGNEECQNGAQCVEDRGGKFCRCLKGTQGHYCQDILGCGELACGQGAECTYDKEKSIAACTCEQFSYDYGSKTCRETCSGNEECQNGAECVEDRGGKFCRCLKGTQGRYCQDILECGELACGQGSECTYDKEKRITACTCEQLSYDYGSKTCRETCSGNEECQNGAECVEDRGGKFCRCLEGTQGHYCQDIPGCGELECGEGATCTYDWERNIAACTCEQMNYDYGSKTCRETCSDNEQCENGAECVQDRGGKFCRCLEGTQGHYCEDITGCGELECGEGAKCTYDSERNIAACTCEQFNYDYGSKTCRETCSDDEQCQNGAECVQDRGGKFCRCIEGTYGHYCEEVRGCEDHRCHPDAICVHDPENRNAKCLCNNRDLKFDYKTESCRGVTSTSTTAVSTRLSTTVRSTPDPARTTSADPCAGHPCQNGGTCFVLGGRTQCLCRKPYLGTLCETDPCDWKPCQNGGVCKTGNGTYKCHCKEPYAGVFCDTRIKMDAYVVTLVAASVFSGFVLMFAACVLCQRRR